MQISIVYIKHCIGWVLLGLLPIACVYYAPVSVIVAIAIGIGLGLVLLTGLRLVMSKE